jgi:hypothetical protein
MARRTACAVGSTRACEVTERRCSRVMNSVTTFCPPIGMNGECHGEVIDEKVTNLWKWTCGRARTQLMPVSDVPWRVYSDMLECVRDGLMPIYLLSVFIGMTCQVNAASHRRVGQPQLAVFSTTFAVPATTSSFCKTALANHMPLVITALPA